MTVLVCAIMGLVLGAGEVATLSEGVIYKSRAIKLTWAGVTFLTALILVVVAFGVGFEMSSLLFSYVLGGLVMWARNRTRTAKPVS